MKTLLSKILFLFSLITLSVATFAAVPDSTTANVAGEVLGGLYNYYSPSLSDHLKTVVTIAAGMAMALMPLFQAYLKKNPNTTPVVGRIGFVLDTATWFVRNTQTQEVDDNVKKK